MEKRYKPNEIYQMVGINRGTLRHYVERGLIAPASVDSENGYAMYGEQELVQMLVLRYYRSLELGVNEIKAFLLDSDLPSQVKLMDDTLAQLDTQIALLTEKRERLARRREQVFRTVTEFEKTLYPGNIKVPMYLLDLDEARRRPDGSALIRELSDRLPHIHISLVGNVENFTAHRPIVTKVGYGAVGSQHLHGLDLSAFRCIPAQPCVVCHARVENPLLIQPHELKPLYDTVEQNGLTVIDGVFGHILSAERINGKFYYYLVMRVHVA